jgi:hypothetical protein
MSFVFIYLLVPAGRDQLIYSLGTLLVCLGEREKKKKRRKQGGRRRDEVGGRGYQ